MWWIFPLSLLILFEAIADILSKEWAVHGNWLRWTAAILVYITANVFWLFALRDGSGLARGSIIFSIASAILGAVIGLVMYKEYLSNIQIAGVAIGIFSLVLIFWNGV